MNGRVVAIEELLEFVGAPSQGQGDGSAAGEADAAADQMLSQAHLLIDRMSAHPGDPDTRSRVADSAQSAFFEGQGVCLLEVYDQPQGSSRWVEFNNRFEADGMTFEEPSVNFFTFNNPYGACRHCEGFGTIIGYDEQKVIPNPRLSLYEGAVACWRGEKMQAWVNDFIDKASPYNFPIHRPYYQLSEEQKKLLWQGDHRELKGIYDFFRHLESHAYKIQYRVLASRYKGKATCPECLGSRLRKDAQYIRVGGYKIHDIVMVSIEEALDRMGQMRFEAHEQKTADRLMREIVTRMELMLNVGLGYLNLMRDSRSLSGGESQRIQLVTSLGSNLTGALYVLDEPSIGLHPRDSDRLLRVLRKLVRLQNTVMVVEHEEEIIREADEVIDIGPRAGESGGKLMFQGSFSELVQNGQTLTASYLSGQKSIPLPPPKPKAKYFLQIEGAMRHNLKDVSVAFPLQRMSVVTGVSGSGKSTLIQEVLLPSVENRLQEAHAQGKFCQSVAFDPGQLEAVEYVDQNPIGRSTRSNPLTYLKALDPVRELLASQRLARQQNLPSRYFSFNVEGGRCENCQGEGVVTVEMQFMADIHLTCEVCGGKRFKPEVLEVRYKGHNIYDILQMTAREAIDFFEDHPDIATRLFPLQQVGLDYLKLGQASTDLSGGEAQRIKLAAFLQKGVSLDRTLFIFDEPTTGLHFHDIHNLLKAFEALLDNGHSLIVIEHNMEVIKCADWVVDLGPEGGNAGGYLIYQGSPQGLCEDKRSYTGRFLKEKLARDAEAVSPQS
jgi:excinuclease ABC subunit A